MKGKGNDGSGNNKESGMELTDKELTIDFLAFERGKTFGRKQALEEVSEAMYKLYCDRIKITRRDSHTLNVMRKLHRDWKDWLEAKLKEV